MLWTNLVNLVDGIGGVVGLSRCCSLTKPYTIEYSTCANVRTQKTQRRLGIHYSIHHPTRRATTVLFEASPTACELPVRSMCSDCHDLLLRKEFPIWTQGASWLQCAADCTLRAGQVPSLTLRHTLPGPSHFIVAVSKHQSTGPLFIDSPMRSYARNYCDATTVLGLGMPLPHAHGTTPPPVAPVCTCRPATPAALDSLDSPPLAIDRIFTCPSNDRTGHDRFDMLSAPSSVAEPEARRPFPRSHLTRRVVGLLWGPKSRPSPR